MRRHIVSPWGLHGGLPGKPNRAFLQTEPGGEWELALKRDGIRLEPGHRVMLVGGGGGGWGEPASRSVDSILADVLAGYVGKEAALRDYSVSVDLERRTAKRIQAPTHAMSTKGKEESAS